MKPRIILMLSENWTLVDPRDISALIQMAKDAEVAGINAVMVSDHVVLGPTADSEGLPLNPRDFVKS